VDRDGRRGAHDLGWGPRRLVLVVVCGGLCEWMGGGGGGLVVVIEAMLSGDWIEVVAKREGQG
jgi:hypothetical protein